MKRILPFLFSFLFLTFFSSAQTIYLKYDEACMSRLEYSSSTESTAYVGYQFDLDDGKQVHFDIGKEAVKWVRDLPGKVIQCEDILVDKDLVRKLNAGAVKIFMIRESPTHYNVSAVKKAIYIDNYRTGVEVVMNDAEFVLDLSSLLSNSNLSKPSSKLAVFLDGTINYQCLKGYIVKKMENFNSETYKEYILIPELGIVEKGSVSKRNGASAGKLKLNMVDEFSFSESVTRICDGIQASYYDGYQPQTKSGSTTTAGSSTTAKNTAGQTAPKAETAEKAIPTSYDDNNPCGTPLPGTHYVQKGETLYSISRRYGVTVEQLKNWNRLRSNSIAVCQLLNIKAKGTTSKGGTSTGTSTGSTTVEGTSAKGTLAQNADVHIVRPNESVAALANMYGYTEERFRLMNNLSAFERIYAGQQLFTSDCACPNEELATAGRTMPYDYTRPVETKPSLTEKGNPDVYFRPVKVHEVKKSETLFSIAKQYDATVDRLLELNGLNKNSKLVAGQRLYVQ